MSLPESTTMHRHEIDGFLTLLAPEIDAARHRLQETVDRLAKSASELPFDPQTVVELFYDSLPGRLLAMISQTLVLELHVARIQGMLAGDTPAARYDSFVHQLAEPKTAAILWQEYPLLAAQTRQCIDQWAAFSGEVLQHLVIDAHALRKFVGSDEALSCLTQITGSSGDRHRDGRSVQMLHFSSGVRLVYKPKPLAAEARFAELLHWLNDRGAQPVLRAARVLDRGDYGWAEFIPFRSCNSPAAVERFYERQGALLALLYTLSATDFHFENLIAYGEYPVLVDLESLFHQRLQQSNNDPASIGYLSSVAKVRLLPQPISVPDLPEAVDFSGLNARPGQPTPFFAADWEGIGTDEVHIVQRRVVTGAGEHLPALHDEPLDVAQYQPQIEAGFTRMYRLLIEQRAPLLSNDGPIARFGATPVRFIARPSQIYQILLQASHHPDRLRNADARRQLFARLQARVEQTPALARLLTAEMADLERGDIPHFTAQPNSTALATSTGDTIAAFFDHTGETIVVERLESLCENDLHKQLWLIRASFAALVKDETEPAEPPAVECSQPTIAAELRVARNMADSLCQLAWWRDGAASWIGFVRRDRVWSIEPLELSAEQGLTGIALFLAQLATLTGELRYRLLAEGAWTTIQRRLHALEQRATPSDYEVAARDALAVRHALLENWGACQQFSTLATMTQGASEPAARETPPSWSGPFYISAAVRSLHLGRPLSH